MTSCCGGCGGVSRSLLKGTDLKLPKNLSVTDYFRTLITSQAIAGSSPAVVNDDGTSIAFTFTQLDSLSTKLSKAIRRHLGFWNSNNPDGDLVIAISLPVSHQLPVFIFAILKLGATFLIIPPSYTEQLIVKIVSMTRPMLVIHDSASPSHSRYNSVSGLVNLVDFQQLLNLSLHGGFDDINEVFPLETLLPPYQRIATIVYTAGTMDQQLAVRIGHREILNRCLWQIKEFPFFPGEVQAQSSPLQDVDSIAEMFVPLLAGFPLHIIPPEVLHEGPSLIQRIKEARISRLTLAPPSFASLLTTYLALDEREALLQPLQSMRYWVLSSESLNKSLITDFFSLKRDKQRPFRIESRARHSIEDPRHVIIHLYGSTEVMSDVTFETLEDDMHFQDKTMDDKVSIGRPIANSIVYIVDEDMRLVEDGIIGEICIAGECVASGGYVAGTEKEDTERFCVNPFTSKKRFQNLYQTEDFGRILESKEGQRRLFYEGRTEMKVKRNGQWVDLRDISKLVSETKLVENCSVICCRPGKADQAIVAFVILKKGKTKEKLEETLQKTIKEPSYIPKVFPVDEFRYLPSGRLDKHKLLKQYMYDIMNASQEEWEQVQVTHIHQRKAAKVLFSAIAKFGHMTIHDVIRLHKGSLWDIGASSEAALSVYLQIRESGYHLDIDVFLKCDTLIDIVDAMKLAPKNDHTNPLTLQKIKLFSMPHDDFYADLIKDSDKGPVLKMLSECYAKKNDICRFFPIPADAVAKLIEGHWKAIVKDSLSVVAFPQSGSGDEGPVGALLVLDACWNCKVASNSIPPIKYWCELVHNADKGPKDHIVWKKKGSATQIYFLGTASHLTTYENILVVAVMLEAAKIMAKTKGYNGTLIASQNPFVMDLCEDILGFKVLEEIQIFKFRSKDKTMPFRLLQEHKTMDVLYDSY